MRCSWFLVSLAVLTGFALQSTARAYDAQQASYQSVADMEQRLAELEAQLRTVEQASYQTQGAEDSYLPPNPDGAAEPNSMPDPGYGGCDSCYGGGYADGGGYGCGSCCNNGYYDGCGSCGACDGVYGSCGYSGYGGCGCEPSCGCGGYGCEPDCGCNGGYGGWGCGGGAVVYSGEILMLRPQQGETYSSQSKFETGSRFTLGYTNGCDQTIRARYFEYGASDISYYSDRFLRLEMLDLEYAGGFCLGRSWTGQIGAGLRWASYDEESVIRYDDTIGPEIGIELHSCPWWYTSFFAGARQSLQFGTPSYYNGNYIETGDLNSFAITEIQVGLEWSRCCRGNTLYCRGTMEAQDWSGVSEDDYDQRLIGWGITVGVTR